MIRLDAVRLVNWYHFADETLRFAGSCLLLGDNGSGKSTVLDALQWALVADQQQVRFNKAANEHSRRNLYGYVRWKLGSEDDTRPGQVRFGRGGCAAYVLLQFTDERDPAGDFTCGIAMEASEADTGVSRLHVVLPRVRVSDVPAVAPGDLVRPLRDFRSAVREIPQARLFADAGTYRDELRHRLGALPEAFHRLLVKALDFKPLGQVKDFVFNYLLDARPVDTAALQANLEHYKQLEAQARDAERRLRALDEVCAQGERIAQERRTAESHRHLAMQAEREMCAERARAAATAIAETEAPSGRTPGRAGSRGEPARIPGPRARPPHQRAVRHARLPADPVAGVGSRAHAARDRGRRRGRGAGATPPREPDGRARRAALPGSARPPTGSTSALRARTASSAPPSLPRSWRGCGKRSRARAPSRTATSRRGRGAWPRRKTP